MQETFLLFYRKAIEKKHPLKPHVFGFCVSPAVHPNTCSYKILVFFHSSVLHIYSYLIPMFFLFQHFFQSYIPIRVFFIGRKSPIFPKFPLYLQGPIKFDISQIFPFFPVSTQTIQNQPRDGPTLIMIYSCFDL
jgi:hypothetical protein